MACVRRRARSTCFYLGRRRWEFAHDSRSAPAHLLAARPDGEELTSSRASATFAFEIGHPGLAKNCTELRHIAAQNEGPVRGN